MTYAGGILGSASLENFAIFKFEPWWPTAGSAALVEFWCRLSFLICWQFFPLPHVFVGTVNLYPKLTLTTIKYLDAVHFSIQLLFSGAWLWTCLDDYGCWILNNLPSLHSNWISKLWLPEGSSYSILWGLSASRGLVGSRASLMRYANSVCST